ncbi:unnamed protein product, partial [Symbiodinium sp. CCMP2456]
REVFDSAVDLILRDDLPKLARLGSRVFKEPDAARCLERMRELVNRRESATAQQAMRCLAQLEASEDSEVQGEMICTEKRLQDWLAKLEEAVPDPAAPEPQKPPEVTCVSFSGAMKRPAEEPEPKRRALNDFFAAPSMEQSEPCHEDLPPCAVAPPSSSEPPEDFMRNAQDKPIFKNSGHLGESKLVECLYEVDASKYEGRGCIWMIWRLPGPLRGLPSKCPYISLRPEPAADLWFIFHKTYMTLLPKPPEGTLLYKVAKGQGPTLMERAAMCKIQAGTMRIMSWDAYNELRGEKAPTFSPRQVLHNYEDMTASEF